MFNRRKALLAAASKGALDMLPLSLAVLPWGIPVSYTHLTLPTIYSV